MSAKSITLAAVLGSLALSACASGDAAIQAVDHDALCRDRIFALEDLPDHVRIAKQFDATGECLAEPVSRPMRTRLLVARAGFALMMNDGAAFRQAVEQLDGAAVISGSASGRKVDQVARLKAIAALTPDPAMPAAARGFLRHAAARGTYYE